jgi:hypothetical protein
MPDVEQSKMVDIDTSGPGADVELENDQPEENTEVETAAEETSTEQVEAKEEPKELEKEQDKEIEQYSESVQRRIAKLTHKWREAERQKDEAAEFARAQIKLREQAETKISKLEPGFMKSTEDSIESGSSQQHKLQLAAAREAGDHWMQKQKLKLQSLSYGYKQAKFAETKIAQSRV